MRKTVIGPCIIGPSIIGLLILLSDQSASVVFGRRAAEYYRTTHFIIGLSVGESVIGLKYYRTLKILSDRGALSDLGFPASIIGLPGCVFIGRGV